MSRSEPRCGRPAQDELGRRRNHDVVDRPAAEPFVLRDGRLAVPTGPGLGIELNEQAVKRMRVD